LNGVNGMETPETNILHIAQTFHPQTLFINYWELDLSYHQRYLSVTVSFRKQGLGDMLFACPSCQTLSNNF